MLKVFQNFFATNLYVKISANKFEAKNLSYNEDNHWQVLHALAPFTNDRLLVAHFVKAETVLQPFIKQLLPKSLIPKSFRILVHPLSHIEGGLSDIEERVLNLKSAVESRKSAQVFDAPRKPLGFSHDQ